MQPFLAGDGRLAAEVARHLALWMAYEDIIRVADLKTRASRFERVRKEVGAKEGEPVVVIDYPQAGRRRVRLCPAALPGKKLSRGPRGAASSTPTTSACTSRPRGVFGYLLVRSLAWLRPLAAVQLPLPRGAGADRALARRWWPRPRGATRRLRSRWPTAPASSRATARPTGAARRNFLAIVDALVENPPTRRRPRAGGGDPQGPRGGAGRPGRQAPRTALGKPVVWLKPVART